MSPTRTALLATLAAAVASGCTWSRVEPLAVTGLEPREAPNHLDVELRVQGRGFDPTVRVDFDGPKRSTVGATFSVTLVAAADRSRVPLVGVALSASAQLRGTLVKGAPVGTYDVEVRDPRGRVAVLPAAFSVFAPDPGCELELAGCEDGDLCTQGDSCALGRCLPGTPITCAASDACHVPGTCAPDTGLCSNPPAPDGTPCFASCAAGDRCQEAVCTPVAGGCANTAPHARLGVSPGGGTSGLTAFTLDASATSDSEDPPSSLQFRFDAGETGSWSAWSSSPTLLQTYAAAGTYTAAVEVLDSGGLTRYATILVVVAAPGDEVKVTTAVDERTAGAAPSAPGGTGLSLWEAIAWVNAQPAPKTITLAAPLTIAMTGPQRELALAAAGAALVAEDGVVIDFDALEKDCLTLDGPGQRLVGVTMTGCAKVFIGMTALSVGSQVAHVTIAGTSLKATGVEAQALGSAPTSRIGPANDFAGLPTAIRVLGGEYEIVGNRLRDGGDGCVADAGSLRLIQNVFSGNTGIGLLLNSGSGPVQLLHNVFDRNGTDGVQTAAVADLAIRDNLFTANGGFGVSAQAAGLQLDHNGYFGNVTGAVSPGLSTGATDLLADPLFVNGPGADYRLLPQSPAIDAGFDTGIDVNGPGPQLFDGAAPDLGAAETR